MPPFIKYGKESKEQRPFGRSPQRAELKRGENSPVGCFQWETYVRGFFLETSVFMHSASNAYLCLQSENVGLSMMCYTLGKANKTCLGERQLRGRIGKLL